MKKYTENITGILMAAFIFTMPVLSIITPDKKFSDSENRVLQQMPKFSVKNITDGTFSKDYTKYFSDQFFIRDSWVGIKSDIVRAIGKKDNNGIYLGRDGYLFQMFDGKDSEFNDKMQAINSFSKSNPKIKKYFMLVPNSVKVLEDKLPPFASPSNQLDYINNVKKSVDSGINFIDVYNALSSHKNEYIYYKTDHHWTTKGAYIAYEEMCKTMGLTASDENDFTVKNVTNDFYGTLYSQSGFRHLKADSINIYMPKNSPEVSVCFDDEKKKADSLYNMDNLKKKDKYTVFLDSNHSLIDIKINNKSSRKIFIIKDSYANSLVPFLTSNYSEIYMIDPRYYNDSVNDFIKSHNVDDALFLYNVETFATDSSIKNITD